MRKAGWLCLSTETSCAETRNSSPRAQLQAQELQGPWLTSAPWDWPPAGSRALDLPSSEVSGSSTLLCCALLPALCRRCYGERVKVAGAKALVQLCQGLHLPGRELLPFHRGGSGCSVWPALKTPGFTASDPRKVAASLCASICPVVQP